MFLDETVKFCSDRPQTDSITLNFFVKSRNYSPFPPLSLLVSLSLCFSVCLSVYLSVCFCLCPCLSACLSLICPMCAIIMISKMKFTFFVIIHHMKFSDSLILSSFAQCVIIMISKMKFTLFAIIHHMKFSAGKNIWEMNDISKLLANEIATVILNPDTSPYYQATAFLVYSCSKKRKNMIS